VKFPVGMMMCLVVATMQNALLLFLVHFLLPAAVEAAGALLWLLLLAERNPLAHPIRRQKIWLLSSAVVGTQLLLLSPTIDYSMASTAKMC
jgi:hypothetical protein